MHSKSFISLPPCRAIASYSILSLPSHDITHPPSLFFNSIFAFRWSYSSFQPHPYFPILPLLSHDTILPFLLDPCFQLYPYLHMILIFPSNRIPLFHFYLCLHIILFFPSKFQLHLYVILPLPLHDTILPFQLHPSVSILLYPYPHMILFFPSNPIPLFSSIFALSLS